MKNHRNSKQRQIILDAVRVRCDHPSADQIYLDVRAKDDRISRGTVYRNLGILSEAGEILQVKLPAADSYDLRAEQHYHIYCTCCRKTFDAPMSYHEEYDKELAQTTGFEIQCHRLVFEGLCPECSQKQNESQDHTN